METPLDPVPHLVDVSRRLAQRALVICENRIELLMVEIQEERERFLRTVLLALGAAAFVLLTGVGLTAIIAVVFWQQSPVRALMVLTAIYASAAVFLFARLSRLHRDWQMLPGTLDQLRKDRECLDKNLN